MSHMTATLLPDSCNGCDAVGPVDPHGYCDDCRAEQGRCPVDPDTGETLHEDITTTDVAGTGGGRSIVICAACDEAIR